MNCNALCSLKNHEECAVGSTQKNCNRALPPARKTICDLRLKAGLALFAVSAQHLYEGEFLSVAYFIGTPFNPNEAGLEERQNPGDIPFTICSTINCHRAVYVDAHSVEEDFKTNGRFFPKGNTELCEILRRFHSLGIKLYAAVRKCPAQSCPSVANFLHDLTGDRDTVGSKGPPCDFLYWVSRHDVQERRFSVPCCNSIRTKMCHVS